MALFTSIILMVGGLVLLWWAGNRTIKYAVELSQLLGVSTFIVGFVLLSISTGLPELSVAVLSILQNASGLSAGDLMGSNLVNITLVLGTAAIVAGKLSMDDRDEGRLLLMLSLTGIIMFYVFITPSLTWIEGVALLAVYAIAIGWMWREGIGKEIIMEERGEGEKELEKDISKGRVGLLLRIFGSVAIILISGRIVVYSALDLTEILGLPLETIGATIVALGTGLPELSLELNSVKRGEYALAMGDIFGSSLANATLVLGILSVLSANGIHLLPIVGIFPFFFGALGIVLFCMFFKKEIDKNAGIALLAIYILYLIIEAELFGFLL